MEFSPPERKEAPVRSRFDKRESALACQRAQATQGSRPRTTLPAHKLDDHRYRFQSEAAAVDDEDKSDVDCRRRCRRRHRTAVWFAFLRFLQGESDEWEATGVDDVAAAIAKQVTQEASSRRHPRPRRRIDSPDFV